MIEDRTHSTNRGLAIVATGKYNQFVIELVESNQSYFGAHTYLFTDRPEDYASLTDCTAIRIPHLGWPKMPLLRFELLSRHLDILKETYLFMIDADCRFVSKVNKSILSHRVGVLHRNITRYRDEMNFEGRTESTAYVAPDEGEKYFACGFWGAHRSEFGKVVKQVSSNIRIDIRNGIRAIWGDESHLNRYFIDNRPTVVLPPNYMCPETNEMFTPYIQHRDKKFKRVNKEDAEGYLKINPEEYANVW